MIRKAPRSVVAVGAGALLLSTVLAGCTAPTDGGGTGTISQEEFDAAMSTPTTLTFWTWVPDIQKEVDMFEAAYPEITVNVENVGQGGPHYQKIRSAIQAGDGAPDVAQIEYQYIPSFVVTGDLLDLTPYGAQEHADDFIPWVWNQVSNGDSVYAYPQDIGPMGNLYRTDVYEAAGIDGPAETWEEYAEDAQAVKDATGNYISNLAAGEPSQFVGFLWQAGVQPFGYDGDQTVSINVNSDGAKEVAQYWQDLIQADLVSTDPGWTDEWFQSLNTAHYSGWLTAAWAPIFLEGAIADSSGNWAAAPLPQWDPANPSSGNWGGSTDAVLSSSKNPIAAAELARWINDEPEPTLAFAAEQKLYPATNFTLENAEFADASSEFFGGQKVAAEFAEIAQTVDTEFQWLPFMDFAYESYNTTVGAALTEKGDIVGSLDAWQDALVQYATEQGFTVK